MNMKITSKENKMEARWVSTGGSSSHCLTSDLLSLDLTSVSDSDAAEGPRQGGENGEGREEISQVCCKEFNNN